MFKRSITLLLVVLLVVGSLAACSNNDDKKDGESKIGEGVKIGMVTDSGTITDKSFNQGTWEGIIMAEKDFGIKKTYLKPDGETTDDYLNNIDNLIGADHGLVITPGYKFGEAVYVAQDTYPDTKFVIIDSAPTKDNDTKIGDNVVAVYFAEQEAGFLAGVAGALESETGKLGFIGGMEIPAVQKFGWGFTAGVAYANANYGTDAQVLDYIYQGTFYEVDAGQQIAASMYDKEIDVIHAAAGGVGAGAITEAVTRRKNDKNVWLIGVDVDQYDQGLYTDTDSAILTSAMKRVDTAAYDYIEAFLKDEFPGGKEILLTAKDGGVGLPAENPNLSEDTVSKTEEVLEGLSNGSIVAPESLDSLMEFLDSVEYVTPENLIY